MTDQDPPSCLNCVRWHPIRGECRIRPWHKGPEPCHGHGSGFGLTGYQRRKRAFRPAAATRHAPLVQVAAKWLREKGHTVVLSDLQAGYGREYADSIGFNGGSSTLVECKASRGDFRRDVDKPFRRDPSLGMGVYRFYLAPAGVIPAAELPAGWGLLENHDGIVREERQSDAFVCDRGAELSMLVSAIRRLGVSEGRGVGISVYEIQSRNDGNARIGIEPDGQPGFAHGWAAAKRVAAELCGRLVADDVEAARLVTAILGLQPPGRIGG